MFLKINYFQNSTLDGMFRIFLAGIVFLCIGETDVCSGAKIDELNRNSTFPQKFSPGKAIKYYKSIENGTNLVPLTYDRLLSEDIEVTKVKNGRNPNTLVATIKSHTCNIPTLLIQHL